MLAPEGAVWSILTKDEGRRTKNEDRQRLLGRIAVMVPDASKERGDVRGSSAIPRATKEYTLKAALCRLSEFL